MENSLADLWTSRKSLRMKKLRRQMEQESPRQCLYVHSNVQFVVVPVLNQTAYCLLFVEMVYSSTYVAN